MQTHLASHQQHLHLLGKPLNILTAEFGEPFGEYPHRGHDVLMFNHNSETITCEIADGLVKSIDTFKDRRTSVRVKPKRTKKAFLRHGGCRHAAVIIDLSIKSVAMKIDDGCLPLKGEFVTFCTNLRTRALTRVYVVLSGHVHRVSEEQNTVVVLLHTPFETHSYRTLLDYISVQQAWATVDMITTPSKQRRDDLLSRDVTIIKSDLCVMCEEGACGIAFAPHKGKKMPKHRGISEH